jgi:hypothetical protein
LGCHVAATVSQRCCTPVAMLPQRCRSIDPVRCTPRPCARDASPKHWGRASLIRQRAPVAQASAFNRRAGRLRPLSFVVATISWSESDGFRAYRPGVPGIPGRTAYISTALGHDAAMIVTRGLRIGSCPGGWPYRDSHPKHLPNRCSDRAAEAGLPKSAFAGVCRAVAELQRKWGCVAGQPAVFPRT